MMVIHHHDGPRERMRLILAPGELHSYGVMQGGQRRIHGRHARAHHIAGGAAHSPQDGHSNQADETGSYVLALPSCLSSYFPAVCFSTRALHLLTCVVRARDAGQVRRVPRVAARAEEQQSCPRPLRGHARIRVRRVIAVASSIFSCLLLCHAVSHLCFGIVGCS